MFGRVLLQAAVASNGVRPSPSARVGGGGSGGGRRNLKTVASKHSARLCSGSIQTIIRFISLHCRIASRVAFVGEFLLAVQLHQNAAVALELLD